MQPDGQKLFRPASASGCELCVLMWQFLIPGKDYSIYGTSNSCIMGLRDLSDMHTQAQVLQAHVVGVNVCLICTPKGHRPEGMGVHIMQIMRARDTTDMRHEIQ